MNAASARSIVMTAAGVILAGVVLYYGGKLPVLSDAWAGLSGRRK